MISKQKRDDLVVQAIREIDFARSYKQGIVWRWQKNEDMYYARKLSSLNANYQQNNDQKSTRAPQPESRANVELGKMQSYVHTFLSKIDSPLTFLFQKTTMADMTRAELLNALKEKDANKGDWNYKDLLGKKQAVIYGRAIFSYYADSYKKVGYCSHLENVDVYDFLIDPSGGGYDLDQAMYLGRSGIKKTKSELEAGMKNGEYIKTETSNLIKGSGNPTSTNQEDVNKQNRYSYIGSPANRTINDTSIYKFWEWYTTYEGERYYLLLSEDNKTAIRVEKLADMFVVNETLGDAMWPFWSWALFPDLTEFWTPSGADYVREVFYAQSVNINQMLDNAERINKPQKAVDEAAIVNMADLIYKRNGNIRVKPGVDVNKAFQIVATPSIDTPLKVYQQLENIVQLESGITAGEKGQADEDKVGIYEGNIAQAADRFGLINKAYAQGYKRMAVLYKNGVEDHLTTKVAVKILGPMGLEKTVWIGRRDVRPQSEYDILIKSSDAEARADVVDKKNKLNFLAGYKADPLVNQKKLFETGAETVGFSHDEIRGFLDVSEFGDSKMISEAERDIEDLINKKVIEPNERANTVYAKQILEYMLDHKEDMDPDTFLIFKDYLERLEPVVIRNMGSQMSSAMAKIGGLGPDGQPVIDPANPGAVVPENGGAGAADLNNNPAAM